MERIRVKKKNLMRAVLLVLGMVLMFPPWTYTFQAKGYGETRRPAGFSFVFSPPKPQRASFNHGIEIDAGLLAIEVFIVSLIYCGLWVSLCRKTGIVELDKI